MCGCCAYPVNYPDIPRSGLPAPGLLRTGFRVSVSECIPDVGTGIPDSAGEFPSQAVRTVPLLPNGHSTTTDSARFLSRLNSIGSVASIVLPSSTAGVVSVAEKGTLVRVFVMRTAGHVSVGMGRRAPLRRDGTEPTLVVTVNSSGEFHTDVRSTTQALERRETVDSLPTLFFESYDELMGTLTPRVLDPIEAIRRDGPESVMNCRSNRRQRTLRRSRRDTLRTPHVNPTPQSGRVDPDTRGTVDQFVERNHGVRNSDVDFRPCGGVFRCGSEHRRIAARSARCGQVGQYTCSNSSRPAASSASTRAGEPASA
jgi:predicted transcriptional regulator